MADKKRAFSKGAPEKKEDYHGGCRFVRTSPNMVDKGVQSINIDMTFTDALRLLAALQSAVMKLNRYDRRGKSGKEMGLCLSVKVARNTIAVIETNLKSEKKPAKE